MHVHPVIHLQFYTVHRLQHQEDVAVSKEGQEKPNISPRRSETHETGEPMGISDVVTDLVSYERNQDILKRVECASVQTMKGHQRTHTESSAEVFNCTYCPKSFTKRYGLQRHLMIHTGDKPFLCKFCPKRFTQLKALKLHHRVHTGEKTVPM